MKISDDETFVLFYGKPPKNIREFKEYVEKYEQFVKTIRSYYNYSSRQETVYEKGKWKCWFDKGFNAILNILIVLCVSLLAFFVYTFLTRL